MNEETIEDRLKKLKTRRIHTNVPNHNVVDVEKSTTQDTIEYATKSSQRETDKTVEKTPKSMESLPYRNTIKINKQKVVSMLKEIYYQYIGKYKPRKIPIHEIRERVSRIKGITYNILDSFLDELYIELDAKSDQELSNRTFDGFSFYGIKSYERIISEIINTHNIPNNRLLHKKAQIMGEKLEIKKKEIIGSFMDDWEQKFREKWDYWGG